MHIQVDQKRVLDNLTRDDVKVLMIAEDEVSD